MDQEEVVLLSFVPFQNPDRVKRTELGSVEDLDGQ